MMRGIISLCPTSANFMDENSLILFAKLFNSDTSVLKCEVVTFKHLLERKADEERGLLSLSSSAVTCILAEVKGGLFRDSANCRNRMPLPVSTAECERNFSSMRLIKNNLRSVSKQDRLESLLVLGIHRDRGSKLDLDIVINRLQTKFPIL